MAQPKALADRPGTRRLAPMTEEGPHRMTAVDERVEERPAPAVSGPKPVFEGTKHRGEQITLYAFVVVPFLAFLAAVPVAWGWGLGWTDVVLFLAFYIVSGLGITVGYHRLVHPRLVQGHPGTADRACDRRPAWRSKGRSSGGWPTTGDTTPSATGRAIRTPRGVMARRSTALLKGLRFAHIGWMFDVEHTNREKLHPGPDARRRHPPRRPALSAVGSGVPCWRRRCSGV